MASELITSNRITLSNGNVVALEQGRGDARAAWTPAESGAVTWEAAFSRASLALPFNITSFPYMLGARDINPWSVELFWVSFGSPAAFYVKQDDELLGYTFGNRCRISRLHYGDRHDFTVGVADLTGYRIERTQSVSLTVGETLPRTLYLSDLAWETATTEYMMVRADKSVGGSGLASAGKRYGKGIGTHPQSTVRYQLQGIFTRLSGLFAIEEQNGAPDTLPARERGRALFSIYGDGRCLLPPTLKTYGDTPEPFDVDITGVATLELLVSAPNDPEPNFAPHADWLDVRVSF